MSANQENTSTLAEPTRANSDAQELLDLRALTTEQEGQLIQLTKQNNQLQQDKEALRQVDTPSAEHVSHLTTKLKESASLGDKLKQEIEQTKALLSATQKENLEKDHRIKLLSNELSSALASYNSSLATIANLKSEIQSLHEITSHSSSSSSPFVSNSEEISHLKGSVAALESEVTLLTKKVASAGSPEEKLKISVAIQESDDQTTFLVMVSTSLPEYPLKYWSVSRRYNQFRALFERIEKQYDLSWFKFPERTYIVSKNDPDVVEERKVAFQKLCETIAMDPVVRVNTTMKQFLDPNDKFDVPLWS